MKYDFVNMPDRRNQGAVKWVNMYMKKQDVSEDVTPMSIADMEFKLPPQIVDGVKKYIDEVVIGYNMPTKEYVYSFINWMKKRHNFEVNVEDIAYTPGIVPGIFQAIKKFSKEGDGVVIMPPVYHKFADAINFSKRKIVNCPLINDNGHYKIDFDLFDKLTQDENNKILLFCSPHNPVGRVWEKGELEKLSQIIIKNKVFLLCDEIHMDVVLKGYKHNVFMNMNSDLVQNMIMFTSLSKTFNLAGTGLSTVVIKNKKLKEQFDEAIIQNYTQPLTTLSYKIAQIAYEECEDYLEECLEVIYENQKITCDFFKEKYPHIKCNEIEGTYLQWVDFRALNMNNSELDDFMINKAQIFADSGYVFGAEGNGFMRFNIAMPKQKLIDNLNRLGKALDELSIS